MLREAGSFPGLPPNQGDGTIGPSTVADAVAEKGVAENPLDFSCLLVSPWSSDADK